ncbi:membrane protein insertase YidC [Porphyromonas sp. COT-290 OH3588]|uniref:membrane protein insertase YidC n=1 Tax=Porphyromonas sp. COT-290 OH3588 TaxID=1515617 RepID=UPI00052D1E6B|nr:membrane protein insertase YidC [Porphyromonas sp. COT-290 OH3588]KGO01122.1 membrane protein insertase YidC [Porphyromonas sp. COT-290 OH3588]
MDRNTLIGLLLIGAILLGFNWFNKPTPEQEAQPTPTEQTLNAPSSVGSINPPPAASMTAVEVDSLGQPMLPAYQQARPVQTVELKNAKLSVKLSTRGGAPVEAILSDYLNNADEGKPDEVKEPVRLFAPEDVRFNLPLRTVQNTMLNTADLTFELVEQTDSTAVMRLPIEQDSYLDFRYKLRSDDYRLDFGIVGHNLERLLPANTSLQDVEWAQRIPQQEQSHKFEAQYSSIYYYTRGGDVDDLSTSGRDEEKVTESLRWLAFKDKYFSSVLINRTGSFDDNVIAIEAMPEDSRYIRSCSMRGTFPFNLRQGAQADFTFFFGPNDYELLRSYDEGVSKDEALNLDHLVYLGVNIFRALNRYLIIPIVSFLKDYISNWGIIILLLTIFIKLLLSPFTYKSYLSQAKMRILRPQVEEINKKYEGKADQETMLKKQRETMALYSSAGASPMSGCLPMLLQMPFLIALYMYFPTSILLRGESFLWAHDLSTYDPVISWDFNIPLVSSLLGNHISLFCLLMTIVNIIYNKYMMSQTASAGGEAMAGMKYMPYMMSIMFFFMFNQNASGLSYYYFISTLITIIQYFAFRYAINEEKLLAKMEENKKKPRKKSKWMERLEEAQRQQQQMQRERQKKGR